VASPQDFLSVLDAIVRSDGGPAGLSGTLAFCSREPAGQRWWQVSLGATADAAFVDRPADHADVLVGLRPLSPGASITTEEVVAQRVNLIFSGDGQLLDRFIQRYLRPASALGIRFGAPS
jgi:hypothetical protein